MSFEGIDPHEFVKHHGSFRRGLKKLLPRDKEYYNCKHCEHPVTQQCDGCKTGIDNGFFIKGAPNLFPIYVQFNLKDI